MLFISEDLINANIDLLENENEYISVLKELEEKQTDLMQMISKENQDLLTNDELALLEYLTVVIFKSTQSVSTIMKLNGKALEEAEEKNWTTFNASSSKNFIKILDTFFEDYPQEDLLALVEDSIQPDEG
ncbi:MAG: hypothetical protein LC127_08390, partial [Chitinophagales bacterium]|nr:hypothetical protein [Chitinophagales bacterium]